MVAVLYRFTEERLGILWREQLTWRLTEAYLSERTYYRLGSATGVANPDQRIPRTCGPSRPRPCRSCCCS